MDEKIEYIRTFEHSQVDRAELKQMFNSVAIFVAMEQGAALSRSLRRSSPC